MPGVQVLTNLMPSAMHPQTFPAKDIGATCSDLIPGRIKYIILDLEVPKRLEVHFWGLTSRSKTLASWSLGALKGISAADRLFDDLKWLKYNFW